MTFLVIAVIIGLIPAAIAQSKGHSFMVWWLYGALLFIVALPQALMMKADTQAVEAQAVASGTMRRCPFCAEMVRREAVVCRFCHRDFPAEVTAVAPGTPTAGVVLSAKCSECGAPNRPDATSCQKCGVSFLDEPQLT